MSDVETSEVQAPESLQTSGLKRFAQAARRHLLAAVESKLDRVLAEGSTARRESAKAVAELERQVKESSSEQVIERVAYTWFNRFCALRFMDVNGYTRVGVVSPSEGFTQPELLAEAKQGLIDEDLRVDRVKVLGLLDGTQPSQDSQGEAYQLLLVAVCNSYHALMPFMFEKIADYTELLIPDDLLSDNSVLSDMRDVLTPKSCKDVEVIGWLYQFYISEKKDDVFAALKKGKKITPENIPAATQLFTPHWIVRYLVENSLGRLWMLNHPDSKLIQKMDYYIKPDESRTVSEPLCWQADWKEQFNHIEGRWRETMWIRPNRALVCDFEQASDYCLTIDGNAYRESRWPNGEIPSKQEKAWEESDFSETAFPDLRYWLFLLQRRYREMGPDDSPDDPFWVCYRAVCNAWDREWQEHRGELVVPPGGNSVASQTEDFLRISSPEEIKICDPACGSGHMLTYAFDLLYAIYEEQGYQATDIPRLILTHNLYGIEIDQRAGALAAFALTMKAREKYRRFLTGGKVVQPNICVLENISIDPEDLSAYMDKVRRDLLGGGLKGVVNQWEEADNFGSLIRPLVTDVSEVLELLEKKEFFSQDEEAAFLAPVHQKVLKALRQADYLSPKYHVVVANPPYMGGRLMNPAMKTFSRKHFEESRYDAFAMFLVRGTELVMQRGCLAMVTMQSWMFLPSFADLRQRILQEYTLPTLAHLGPRAFPTISGEVVQTCAFVIEKLANPDHRPAFIRLFDGDSEDKRVSLCAGASRVTSLRQRDFGDVPLSPLVYWISEQARQAFARGIALSEIGMPRQGNTTTDNNRFVRSWFEVSRLKLGIGLESLEEFAAKLFKWAPYNKGGGTRKWYGLNESVVNWEQNGAEIKAIPHSVIANESLYMRDGITWSTISSSKFGFRSFGNGFIFDNKGACLFLDDNLKGYLLALLNSRISKTLLIDFVPSVSIQPGDVGRLPVILPKQLQTQKEISHLAGECTSIAKADWDESELSWDFDRHPILSSVKTFSLDARTRDLLNEWKERGAIACRNERAINTALINIYELDDELSPEIPLSEISLSCNPLYSYGSDKSDSDLEALLLADTMREFISYAVGCMLGRYSLDKPGLILANQGATADDYRQQIPEPTFAPDEDNVIPLLDGDWFEDDITERFKAFLKVTFGTEHYEENLTYLENALYPDNLTGKKRKTIRDYFLKEFYNHHLKLYKKRPIYWLFSSPKGTFNALIYMHRYRPDTVSVVLGYLRDFRDKLTHHTTHLQSVADSSEGSKTEKTAALKKIAELKKQLKELDDYERKTLFPLAQQQITIDLDDGVKANYPKFGDALKKIPGLDASDE